MSGWKITGIDYNDRYIDVYIEFKYALLNSSKNQNINMMSLRTAINKSITLVYEKSFYGMERIPYSFHLCTNGRIISSCRQRMSDEYLLEIKNSKDLPHKRAETIHPLAKIEINEEIVGDIILGNNRTTIPHELGHTLGLMHVDDIRSCFSKRYLYMNVYANANQYMNRDMQSINKTNVMMSGGSKYLNHKKSITLKKWQLQLMLSYLRMCCYK